MSDRSESLTSLIGLGIWEKFENFIFNTPGLEKFGNLPLRLGISFKAGENVKMFKKL